MAQTLYSGSAEDNAVQDGATESPNLKDCGANNPATYVHPDALKMFNAFPWTKHIPLFTTSSEGMGPKVTMALSTCFFLNKGLSAYLADYCRYAMFRDRFGIDGTRYQRLATLQDMGWSVKAFSACVSDTFALFGYTKRWYCAGSCVVGAAFALALGVLPAKVQSANTGAGFLFLTNFCMANVDILLDGHYTRMLRKRPACGPALVSWIYTFIFIAALIAAAIQGPLSDKGIPQVGLFIAAAAQLVTVLFFIFNWCEERYNKIERYEDLMHAAEERWRLLADAEPVSDDAGKDATKLAAVSAVVERGDSAAYAPDAQHRGSEQSGELRQALDTAMDVDDSEDVADVDQTSYIYSCCCGVVEVNKEVFFRNWRLYVYAGVMVACVVVQCLVTVFGTSHDLGWSSLAVAVTCCSVAFWACRLVVAKAIVFVFLHMLLYLHVPGALDSFYMATEECYPDGPHFSYTFYNTIGAVIGDIGGLCGVTAFSYIFSKHSYCVTFVATTVIQVTSSVFDIIMVKRWNLYIGIPDHAMYIMGDSIVFQVCLQLCWMPLVLLFSRICPRGSESVIYALVSGISNLGLSMAQTVGSILLELVWPIQTTGVNGCDFHNMPMLLLVCHILVPLSVIPLSFLLLPRARICDDIDQDGRAIRPDGTKAGVAVAEPVLREETQREGRQPM